VQFIYVKCSYRSALITLQALSSEDLKQWLHIMDGKDPVYAKMSNFGLLQEIESD